MTTLKSAREKGELDKFIKQHEKSSDGDKARFEKTLKSISSTPEQKKKSARGTSRKGSS